MVGRVSHNRTTLVRKHTYMSTRFQLGARFLYRSTLTSHFLAVRRCTIKSCRLFLCVARFHFGQAIALFVNNTSLTFQGSWITAKIGPRGLASLKGEQQFYSSLSGMFTITRD